MSRETPLVNADVTQELPLRDQLNLRRTDISKDISKAVEEVFPSIRLEWIGPKEAREMLRHNHINRPKRKKYIVKLARAMKNGEWQVNGETIKLCGDILVDGQHRLEAIILAGLSIQMCVARGIDQKAFDTIDQGMPRRLSDVFSRNGVKNYTHVSSAVNWVRRIEWSDMSAILPSAPEAVTWFEDNKAISHSVQLMVDWQIRDIMSASVAAALHFLCAQKDSDLADEFWESVATGENLAKTSPAYQLRSRLIKNRRDRYHSVNKLTILALSIKAWNIERSGQECKNLRWNVHSGFPEFE